MVDYEVSRRGVLGNEDESKLNYFAISRIMELMSLSVHSDNCRYCANKLEVWRIFGYEIEDMGEGYILRLPTGSSVNLSEEIMGGLESNLSLEDIDSSEGELGGLDYS